MRAAILREISIPVSVGLAPTKVLAKLAREVVLRDDLLVATGERADVSAFVAQLGEDLAIRPFNLGGEMICYVW